MEEELHQPLHLDIEDKDLLEFIKNFKSNAKEHWDSSDINLTKRREENLKYLFGRQLKGKRLKNYESEYIDNLVYEFEATLKSLALSKMPDIIVKPAEYGNQEKEKTAELLTSFNDKEINKNEFKKQLGIMFKHLPVYLIACMKYRYDATRGKNGAVIFEVIHPDKITLDPSVNSPNPDNMTIIHNVTKTGIEWQVLFPNQKEVIKKEILKKHPGLKDSDNKTVMLTKIEGEEVWFDWIEENKEDETKFDFISGVVWKLGDNILGKSKNPNWDYEGHTVMTIDGQPVSPDMLQQMIMTGVNPPNIQQETVYNNYFDHPRKPFIFMNFEQFLLSAIDETSRIEQTLPMQKSNDTSERAIDYMVTSSKGKHIFSKESGLTKETLESLDLNNPEKDLLVNGNVRDVHSFIQAVMPPAEMFNYVAGRRDRAFSKVGVHGATRGEITTSVATTNQISREADFTRSDNIVDETILHVVTEVSKARLHMMKLRYTEDNFVRVLGQEGKDLHIRLTNDSIEDGMEVEVSASSTDKLKAERNAKDMAQLNMIDPLTYYRDLGLSDPEGRAEKMFLKETNPEMYYQKFILKKDMTEMANQVTGQPLQPKGMEQPPQQPSPQDTSNIATQPQGSPRGIIGGIKNLLGV